MYVSFAGTMEVYQVATVAESILGKLWLEKTKFAGTKIVIREALNENKICCESHSSAAFSLVMKSDFKLLHCTSVL